MPHSISPNPIKDEPMDAEAGIPSDAVPAKSSADDDVDMNDEPQTEAPPAGQAEEVKKEVKLDELFADEDSDEEFPSSAPVKREGASSPARAASPSYVASCPPATLMWKKSISD
jgi:DNA primase small subunit